MQNGKITMWWTVHSVSTNHVSTMNVSLPPGNYKVFKIHNNLSKMRLWMLHDFVISSSKTVEIKIILTISPFVPGGPHSPLSPFIRNQKVHS